MTLHVNGGPFHFYPNERLVGVLAGLAEARTLTADLTALGLAEQDLFVLAGEAGADWLDPEGERHGLLGRLIRWSEGLTDEHDELRRYAGELAGGRCIVATHIHRRSGSFDVVLAAYQRRGARMLRYFGPEVIEGEPG